MAVTIKLKYVRHSAKKLRPYTRVVSGKNLEVALNETSVMPQDSARFIHKALLMAKAAAVAKEFDSEGLVVSEIMATEGPKIKRMRPNARGRSNSYQKHLAHIVVSVDVAPTIKEKKAKRAIKPKKAEEK